jgi:glycosyltransferase involved in cell wall biosynthesis
LRVLVLAVHPDQSAGTRLRASQYAPALESAGIDLAVWSFLSPDRLEGWLSGRIYPRLKAVVAGIVRVIRVGRQVRKADVVVVRREVLPLGPPLLERWIARRRPMVWDVDDAVWLAHKAPGLGWTPWRLRAPRHKYEELCSIATEVWAGSEVLAEWCRQQNAHVVVVPTVVEVADAQPLPPPNGRRVLWIGSPSTVRFMEAILPALAAIEPAVEVDMIGGSPAVIPEGLTVRSARWSASGEAEALASAHVGLYPLDRSHPTVEGKCGLKAILYMAHGVPCVVTPTATNAEIVRDGVEGLHAESPEDWTEAVRRLLSDDDLWRNCRREGWARARSRYSLQALSPLVIDRLNTLGGKPWISAS